MPHAPSLAEAEALFAPYLQRWRLTPDGEALLTPSGALLPVRQEGRAAMLKVSQNEDERLGARVMQAWNGAGAAQVLEIDGDGLLLEHGGAPLIAMAQDGDDGLATTLLCRALARLHAYDGHRPEGLKDLHAWFADLAPAARRHGGFLVEADALARQLLAAPCEQRLLHGDLHHGNLLDFGPRGWLAIDPKGLVGDRALDYAVIFANPDLCDPSRPVGTDPARFQRRLAIVCRESGLERQRLLQWLVAWCGLSAAWFLDDDDPNADIDLAVGALALEALATQ
ncbi:aminoglycoside phosphotransferase family protein [Pseudomonas sp. No.21]|uniref:aminoglycoside phosphotransferase family protein n=1 Tax=Pseudomonas tohonis TaxID=2725477 RepID=UPI001F39D97C|nr:aminoglycoside phosphotransferase family protein [Pseudomonas tohonis]GJN47070.1 streptomycin 3''-phosphotransferase [Pseudomonas tohonis]